MIDHLREEYENLMSDPRKRARFVKGHYDTVLEELDTAIREGNAKLEAELREFLES
jgi:hypothetical protein